METVVFLYATAPDEATARTIAAQLVESGAAACVNIIPGMTSFYRWRGAVETATEVVLIIKTTQATGARAVEVITACHPYEVPAIASLVIDESLSSQPFCDWVRKSCGVAGS